MLLQLYKVVNYIMINKNVYNVKKMEHQNYFYHKINNVVKHIYSQIVFIVLKQIDLMNFVEI